jgi:hypothetical protein
MDKEYYWVFTAGDYPQGKFSVADVKQIAENYDPEFCEAPFWIGHPSMDAEPEALAWVGGCYADDEGKLYVWFSSIDQELIDLVNSKKFKRCSIELWKFDSKPGWYLYAIGLTNRPQISNLKPMEFAHAGLHFGGVVAQRALINMKSILSFKQKDKKFFTNQNLTNTKMTSTELKQFAESKGIDTADCKSDADLIKKVSAFFSQVEVDLNDAKQKVVKFTADTKTLEEKIAEFELKELKTIIQFGIQAKRIVPTQEESLLRNFAKNPEGLKAFINEQPVQTLFEADVIDKSKAVNPEISKFTKDGKQMTYVAFLAECKQNPKFAEQFTNEEIAKLRAETYE